MSLNPKCQSVGIARLYPTSGTMNLFNQEFGEGWSNLRPFLQNVYKEKPRCTASGLFWLQYSKSLPAGSKAPHHTA